MKKYFGRPTQVVFLESEDVTDNPRWLGGIAFGDVIICGECGSTIEMDNLADLHELPWIDINETIRGDAY